MAPRKKRTTTARTSASVAAVLIGLATYVLMIYVGVLLAFAQSAYVVEDVGVVAALGRSRALVRGAWWRVFGVLLLVGVMFAVVILVITVPIAVVGGTAGSFPSGGAGVTAGPSLTVTVLSVLAAVVVGSVGVPFLTGVAGLLYTDRRIRTERFDLELAARAAGQPGPGTPW